tara:strand:- start:16 stop:468 length:453 start_codon:yes stop_codon:yes gene_type:complete
MQSRLQHRKQGRDIIYLRQGDSPAADYLWNLSVVMDYCVSRYSLREAQIKLILHIYSMESFLLGPMAERYNRDSEKLWLKVMKDLVVREFIKEETYSHGPDEVFYADENYKSRRNGISKRRWTLSPKGRMFASKFYQYLEGTRSMDSSVL